MAPRWVTAAALLVAAAGTACLAETGPAAAIDHDTVVDCEHNPNALQLALINPQAGAMLQIKGACFGNFVINTDLKLIGLDNAVLDGRDTGTTVTINNARVELRNLTILHDRAGSNGRGVLNNGGTVTLSDSTVRNNTAPDGGQGGCKFRDRVDHPYPAGVDAATAQARDR